MGRRPPRDYSAPASDRSGLPIVIAQFVNLLCIFLATKHVLLLHTGPHVILTNLCAVLLSMIHFTDTSSRQFTLTFYVNLGWCEVDPW